MIKETRYLLDTSILVDLLRGEKNAISCHKDIIGMETTTTLCLFELAKHAKEDFKSLFSGKEILPYSINDALEGGKIHRECNLNGTPIGTIDTLIAGIARNRNLTLVTRDSDFLKVKNLKTKLYQ